VLGSVVWVLKAAKFCLGPYGLQSGLMGKTKGRSP